MEKIIQKIESETRKRVNNITRSARDEANAIIEQARSEASTEKKSLLHKGMIAAEQEKTRIISQAHNRARTEKLARMDAWLQEVYARVEKNLLSIRKEKQYKAVLNQLIAEGVHGINTPSIVVSVSPLDKGTVKKPSTKASVRIVTNKDIVTGAIISAKDGSAVINNSFSEVLKQKWPHMKKQAMEALIA
jgi:vacuolar-type H+-ATPase subunit E/Vma4